MSNRHMAGVVMLLALMLGGWLLYRAVSTADGGRFAEATYWLLWGFWTLRLGGKASNLLRGDGDAD